jgi:uncharacterized protein YoxC
MKTIAELTTENEQLREERDFLLERTNELGRDINELFARSNALEQKLNQMQMLLV